MYAQSEVNRYYYELVSDIRSRWATSPLYRPFFPSVYCAAITASATRSAGNQGSNRARARRETERERPLVRSNI